MKKSDEAWREQLTPEQYEVTRCKDTERPFSGEYHDHTETGSYHCVCCGNELFHSSTKFDAGCGWPSYSQPVRPDAVVEYPDSSHGMIRTEVCCAQCDAHLGHVFNDGPAPTGLRYCINSVALHFKQ